MWRLVYSQDDLTREAQYFGHEGKWHNVIRFLLLLLNVGNIAFIVHIYNFHRLIMFFTNWTVCMTVVYFLIAIPASRTRSLLLLAMHHVCFEIMFMMNFIVVVVFWSLLYNEAIKDCKGDPK
jgi:hypothetical protein